MDLNGINELKSKIMRENSSRKSKTTEDLDMILQLESMLNESSTI